MTNYHGYGKANIEVNLLMSEKKMPHEKMTEKNNGLSSAQEVTYQNEFKKADNAVKNDTKAERQNRKS